MNFDQKNSGMHSTTATQNLNMLAYDGHKSILGVVFCFVFQLAPKFIESSIFEDKKNERLPSHCSNENFRKSNWDQNEKKKKNKAKI